MAKVLVTGASTGIGKELVHSLMHKGHTVWAVARNIEKLQHNGAGYSADRYFFSGCDVTEKEQWQCLKEQMDTAGFVPDVLLLNAGVTSNSPAENHAVNYNGVLNGINEFIEELRKRGGLVAVSGSLFAFVRAPFNLSYCESKRDVYELLKKLAAEPANNKVRFNYFVLGPVDVGNNATPVPWWKRELIPSAATAAEYMVQKLGDGGLIHKFPFSTNALLLINRLLPQSVMDGLVNRLRR